MARPLNLDEQKQKRDSITMSVIIHALLLMLLLLPIVSAIQDKPPVPPKFQGIQVAFGSISAEKRTENKPAPAPAQKQKITKPTKPAAKPPTKSSVEPAPKATPVKVVSETLEKESIVKAVKVPVKNTKQNKEKAVAKAKADAEQKAREQAEEVAKREAEEAERKAKKEAAEKAAKLAAEKAAAKSKFNNILNSADGTDTPSKGNPNGSPDASALEGMSTGKGKAGNGLGDRGLIYAPDISDSSQRTGKIVINICVNASGKVTKANFTQKGSTTTDSHLIKLATKSAKEYRFSESNSEEQCGDITIDFKLR